MQDTNVPLFKDWDTYSATLARRAYRDAYYALNEDDYWANEEYLQEMVDCIWDGPRKIVGLGGSCRIVGYVAVPSTSGKTSCGLSVFYNL